MLIRLVFALLVLAAFPTATQAAFPGQDGRIHFVNYRHAHPELATIEPDGSDEQTITSGDAFPFDPAPAPDGYRVAYTQQGDLWIRRLDTGERTRLTETVFPESQPTWTPDGRHLVVVSVIDGLSQLERIGADGGSRDTLIAATQDMLISPAVSPDGTRVAYTRGNLATEAVAVHALTLATGADAAIGPAGSTDADWSPDGTLIAFVRNGRLFVAPPGGAMSPVGAAGGIEGREPSFAPSGTAIAFTGIVDGRQQVRAVTLDGDGAWDGDEPARTVTTVETYGARGPAWAIAPGTPAAPGATATPVPGTAPGPPAPATPVRYYGGRVFATGIQDDREGEIYSFNPGGGDLRRLTRRAGRDRDPDASRPLSGVPQRIAFTRSISGRTEVWTMRPDGSAAERFRASLPPEASDPSWGPDGRSIAFVGRLAPGAKPRIYIAREGGEARVIGAPPADASDTEPAFSPDGSRVVFRRTEPDAWVGIRRRLCVVTPAGGAERCSYTPEELRAATCTAQQSLGCLAPRDLGLLASRGAPTWSGDSVWSTAGETEHANSALSPPYGLYSDTGDLTLYPLQVGAAGNVLKLRRVHVIFSGAESIVWGLPSPAGDHALLGLAVGNEDRLRLGELDPRGFLAPDALDVTPPGLQLVGLPSWAAAVEPPSNGARGAFGSSARVGVSGLRVRAGTLQAMIANREPFAVTGTLRVRRAGGAAAAGCTGGKTKRFTVAPRSRARVRVRVVGRGRLRVCAVLTDRTGGRRTLTRTVR